MAGYRLTIKPSAVKELESINAKGDRQRVVARIEALSADPRPHGCEKLGGHATLYRVRQGRYRVVYAVDDRTRIVDVIGIGDRREVYRRP